MTLVQTRAGARQQACTGSQSQSGLREEELLWQRRPGVGPGPGIGVTLGHVLQIVLADAERVDRQADPNGLERLGAQIEYLLREALRKAGRLPKPRRPPSEENDT